jgi:hypothetical protein
MSTGAAPRLRQKLRAWKPCLSNAISIIRVSGKRANDAARADWLLDYEIKLIDQAGDAADLDVSVAH